MLHYVCSYKATSASQSRLAVHRNGTFSRLTYGQEFLQYNITWCTAINEEQILVLEASILERGGMIDLRIQPYHGGHKIIPEVCKVTFRRMTWISVGQRLRLLMWPTKGDKLLRHYPIEISILYTLKVLVLFCIKVIEIYETRLQALVDGIEAVEQ